MNRLMEKMVLFGLVMAWRLAGLPILRSPPSVKATTDGVVRCPSLLMMTVGWLPSITATQEFVVPRSMPIILPMILFDLFVLQFVAAQFGRRNQFIEHCAKSAPADNLAEALA